MKYVVQLTEEERLQLQRIVSSGTAPARKIRTNSAQIRQQPWGAELERPGHLRCIRCLGDHRHHRAQG